LHNRSCLAGPAVSKKGSRRAGAGGGARAGKPRCVRILTITATT
jgi:hypothetical protein